MKKALGPILGLILILLLGSPWFVGKQIETFYREITREALEKNPALEMTDLIYQRGWFTSTVTATIRITYMGQEQPLPFEVRYTSTLTHGPVFWNALSSASPMGLALDASTLWLTPHDGATGDPDGILEALPPFKTKSTIGFDKVISTVYNIAAHTQTLTSEKGAVDLDFAGLNGSSLFHWGSPDFNFKAEIPSLRMTQGENQRLVIDNLMISAHKKGPDSNARYDIQKVSMENKAFNIHFTLDKPYVEGRYTEDETVYSADLESGFDALAANNLAYAPARLHLKLENLDKKAIKALGKTLSEAKNDDIHSDIYGMMMMGKIMALLPDILKQSPRLTLSTLTLGTGNGESITATGHAAILGDKASTLPSIALIMQALDAEIQAKLPKKFMNTFLDLGKLMQLMDQGLLVSDGKYYRIEAMVQGGHLTLNGTPLM